MPSIHLRGPLDVQIMAPWEPLDIQDTTSLAPEQMAIDLEETILDLDNDGSKIQPAKFKISHNVLTLKQSPGNLMHWGTPVKPSRR